MAFVCDSPGTVHLSSSGPVPIRLETLKERTSPGLVETGENGANGTTTEEAERARPVTQWTSPDATTSPFRRSSMRRSNAEPESLLLFRPIQRRAGPRAVSPDFGGEGGGVGVGVEVGDDVGVGVGVGVGVEGGVGVGVEVGVGVGGGGEKAIPDILLTAEPKEPMRVTSPVAVSM